MRIGDIINVKDIVDGGHWKGKVTEIHKTKLITVQDKGINFAVVNLDELSFDSNKNEYWEK